MKKSILWVIGLLFSVSFTVVSCDETTGVPDPYTDWEVRNQLYIDSIAKVARANMGTEVGQWRVVHTYKFDPPLNDLNPNVNDYVYCKILENGTGTVNPLFTDSVEVHYRGQLIPLYDGSKLVFDQSFQGELNSNVAEPIVVDIDGNWIEGWKIVLQEMVEGDRWEVYIPQEHAYDTYGKGSVPGYSTLIFDMQLVKIYTNR